MPLFTRAKRYHIGESLLLCQRVGEHPMRYLCLTLGKYHPYRLSNGSIVPAILPDWTLLAFSHGVTIFEDVRTEDEIEIDTELVLSPYGIICHDDRFEVKSYLKQAVKALWPLYENNYAK